MSHTMYDAELRLRNRIAELEAENAKLRAVADAAKNYFTEDLDSGIDMSRKWFKSYNMVKDALAALETTNG